MEKKCYTCKQVKGLDEFSNDKKGEYGKAWKCKSCFKEYRKKHYEENNEKINEKVRLYRRNNKEKVKEYKKKYKQGNNRYMIKYQKEWYQKNKEKVKEYRENNKEKVKEYKKNWAKEWYKNNKEKQRLISAKYHKDNKETILKRHNVWAKEKKKTDVLYKLRCTVRVNLVTSLKRQGYSKKTKTYNMLKCEYDFFLEWLNGIASNGYTYGVGDLHLDHVVPVSLAQTEEEAILLNHYSNFQLLSANENLSKNNRYVNPINLKRVLEHHPNPDKIREIHARL